MTPQKRLDELLREDQEPFLLNNYIADRRTHLRPSSLNRLQKRKPISQTHHCPDFFCKNACFLSPDQRKSALLAANTPCRSPKNAIFLHISAPSTALLIEAALRIQKHSNTRKHQGCGIFGSIMKKLRNRNRKREIESPKDILKWDSCVGRDEMKNGGCSGNGSRQSEEESTLCGDLGLCDGPFGFVLQVQGTPSTPAPSPSHPISQESERLKKLQGGEEDKEQCSPVSVLDAPFEHDDDEDSFDIQGSYAIVQRAKQQLLHKIQRFEKLARLDPIELDKRMLDDDEEDQEPNNREDFRTPSFHQDWKIPKYMHLLVSDLTAEEEKQQVFSDDQEMMRRVLKRLESWKDVESNTIDMMVDQDFRREYGAWNQNQQQVKETSAEIELHIFRVLVEELLN